MTRLRFSFDKFYPVFIGAGLLWPLLLTGCPDSSPPNTNTNRNNNSASNQCEELVSGVLDMTRPDRLEISSDADSATVLLNQWNSTCLNESHEQLTLSDENRSAAKKMMAIGPFEDYTSDRFDMRDARYLRDCLVNQSVVNTLVNSAETDLERMVGTWSYVVRNVQLDEAVGDYVSPFDALLIGRGSSVHRAGLFAGMMRQLGLDTVVIAPKETPVADNSTFGNDWLVGCLLNKQIFLFDPVLGLPIPATEQSDNDAIITQPATLKTMVAGDTGLGNWNDALGKPYRLSADLLKSPNVHLIEPARAWSIRMQRFQLELTGDRSVIIARSLFDNQVGPGAITAIVEAGEGSIAESDIALWSKSATFDHDVKKMSEASRKIYERSLEWLGTPFIPTDRDDEAMRMEFGEAMREMHKARLQQLWGEKSSDVNAHYADAIQHYQSVRLRMLPRPEWAYPEGIPETYAEATEAAYFWTALCQLEQGDSATAAEMMRDYLALYEDGQWATACRRALATALAQEGAFAEAASVLMSKDLNAGDAAATKILTNRWKSLAE